MYRYRIKEYIGFVLFLSVISFMVFYNWVFEPVQKKDHGRVLLEGPLDESVQIKKTIRQSILSTTTTNGPTEFWTQYPTSIDCVNCTTYKRPTSETVYTVASKSLDTNEDRLTKLRLECQRNVNGFKAKAGRSYYYNTILSKSKKLIFCQIQKSASTFWKKLVFNVTSIGLRSLSNLHNLKTKDDNLTDHFKFSFVREPYHRLFSGYVDKLFTPNVIYWRTAGIPAKKFSRLQGKKIVCGHDVTFAEFLNYIVKVEQTPEKRDRHFFSMYEHCEPCDHKRMDYVGKMETFDRDAQLILKSIKADNKTVSQYYELRSKSKLIEMKSMVKRLFDTKNAILKCMSMYEAVTRFWRRLQINGIIGRNIVFPFTPTSVKTLTRSDFEEKLLKAHIQSRTDKTLKYNKNDAFSEAFASVSYETLSKLRNVVEKDCLLFGYDIQPKGVFNATMFLKSKFSFFRV